MFILETVSFVVITARVLKIVGMCGFTAVKEENIQKSNVFLH
jgi:hypothetical protein